MALDDDRRTTNGPWNARYSQDLIEHLPVGIYICNQEAVVVAYNFKAAEIWGETPVRGDPKVKFCGAHKLYTGDGIYLPHDQIPMVQVLAASVAGIECRRAVLGLQGRGLRLQLQPCRRTYA